MYVVEGSYLGVKYYYNGNKRWVDKLFDARFFDYMQDASNVIGDFLYNNGDNIERLEFGKWKKCGKIAYAEVNYYDDSDIAKQMLTNNGYNFS